MLFASLLLLLCLCITALLSPVVFHYEKNEKAALSLHFVFFCVFLYKKEESSKGEKNEKRKKGRSGSGSAFSVLKRLLPHSTVHIRSLPLITLSDPMKNAILTGGYYFLLSLALSRFGGISSLPLLKEKTEPISAVDIQIRLRLYTVLYTFLVYMTKYRKEKEKMNDGRNENERYHPNLS